MSLVWNFFPAFGTLGVDESPMMTAIYVSHTSTWNYTEDDLEYCLALHR